MPKDEKCSDDHDSLSLSDHDVGRGKDLCEGRASP